MSKNEAIAKNLEPGEMKAAEAGGITILVANVEGTFYAINNVCTHRQCPLSAGSLEGPIVTCACHLSKFDVRTGEVVGGPATRSEEAYRVIEKEGVLEIDVKNTAA